MLAEILESYGMTAFGYLDTFFGKSIYNGSLLQNVFCITSK